MLRSIYPEWYEHDDESLDEIMKTGTIALDANVLLSLYRISAPARENVLNVLADDSVRPRLFIPYQVGLEYLRNRVDVARSQSSGYRALRNTIDAYKKSLTDDVNDSSKGLRDKAVKSDINKAIEKHLDELSEDITSIQSQHVIDYEQFRVSDPVLDRLEQILTGTDQIATKPDDETLAGRRKKAKDRITAKVPPGYGDASKDDPSGDYLVWCELLDRAATNTAPMLFVTDDKKQDWYQLDKQKQILGPRPELRVEMAPHIYHQMTLDHFLRLVETHLSITVDRGTVEQVTTASRQRVATLPYRPTPLTKPELRELLGSRYSQSRELADILDGQTRRLVASGLPPSKQADVASRLTDVILTWTRTDADRAQALDALNEHEDGRDEPDAEEIADELRRERDWDNYLAVADSETEEDGGPEES